MRKWHKKQILELVKTMGDACRELNDQKDECFTGLCAEMQDFVSNVFDYVEEAVGGDSRLSELLKSFYEMLYQAVQGQATIKQLLRSVHKLEREVDSLRPDKIEVVFFCYKASMSDSLESVYFAAKEDPACAAYFVPIPYFDRNPDGSLGQMHIEGEGCYPDSYELTDWTAYDVEARHPEAVFIMNPYDECNLVTSVHPAYYSKRLREQTELLVYIEYGLPLWMYRDPDIEYEAIIRKGNILPVYFYCHYYIAYSKEVAAYFRSLFHVHSDAVQSFGLTPQKINEKFVPLGSPKFDKVLHNRREDYPLPEEWDKLVKGRKVVLYNCSLSELLKSSGQQPGSEGEPDDCLYFKKLRTVIEVFQGCEDAVLWLRPHPLFEATLKSMRPALFREYSSLVQDFTASGTGIFDGTQDLHRAIVWSDAMISDESSLLFLYLSTGKPFYIPSIIQILKDPVYETGEDFHVPLTRQLENMKTAKGANVFNANFCIWWHNFLEEDLVGNRCFEHFTGRFLDYVTHPEKYPEAEEYQRLQLQMFRDFVSNADGTAGQKIYDFIKQKSMT